MRTYKKEDHAHTKPIRNAKRLKRQGDRGNIPHGFEGVGSILENYNRFSGKTTTMVSYKHKEDVNEFIGITDDGTYVFLDKLFDHGNGLHGATGTRLRPVSEEYVENRIEEIKDYEWSPIAHIYDEQNVPESWDEWINNWSHRELEDLAVDPSGGKYWDKTREVCEEHEDFEFYMTNCIGGGRMFSDSYESDPDNYQYLENAELLEKARQAENGEYFE